MLVVLYRGDEIDGAAVAALSLLLLDNHGVQVVDFNDGEEGFADVTASAERVLVIGEYDWNVIQSLCSNAVHVYLYEHSYMRHYRTEEVDNYIKHVDDVIVGYGSGEDSCGAVDALLLFCEDQFCNPAKALIERLKNEAYIDFINDYSKGIRDTKMKEFIAGIDVIATSKSSPRPYIRVLGRILATGMNIDSLLDKGYDRLKGLFAFLHFVSCIASTSNLHSFPQKINSR